MYVQDLSKDRENHLLNMIVELSDRPRIVVSCFILKEIKMRKSVNLSTKIKVSVIVPVYNAEKYLASCLDSILHQSLKEIEVICINDGSEDGSLKILEQYALQDKRVHIIDQENQGVSVARNNGIKQAQGEYIGFVDSDDWIDTDFYEKLYQTAEKTGVDIIACGIIYHGWRKTKTMLHADVNQAADNLKDICALFHIPTLNYIWNKIYKCDWIKANKLYFPEQTTYEDMYWSCQVMERAQKAALICGPNYHYRYVPTSIVNTTLTDNLKKTDYKKAFQYLQDFAVTHQLDITQMYNYRIKVKIFGLKVLKITVVEGYYKRYDLFGLKVMEKIIKRKI